MTPRELVDAFREGLPLNICDTWTPEGDFGVDTVCRHCYQNAAAHRARQAAALLDRLLDEQISARTVYANIREWLLDYGVKVETHDWAHYKGALAHSFRGYAQRLEALAAGQPPFLKVFDKLRQIERRVHELEEWNRVEETPAPIDGSPFLAYSPAFVDEDFNADGIIEACAEGDHFVGAIWDGQFDLWNTLPVTFTHWKLRPAPPETLLPKPSEPFVAATPLELLEQTMKRARLEIDSTSAFFAPPAGRLVTSSEDAERLIAVFVATYTIYRQALYEMRACYPNLADEVERQTQVAHVD